ncbi:MAG: membrane protein [Desulfatitalea sp. BRH_c12]|nr:MAG: membrane protein [Desulfatitalea sp. BRH_c12]
MSLFLSIWIKLFFVFTPFFGLSMFLSTTEGYDEGRRRRLAMTVSMAVAVLCLILFFGGRQLFSLFGITLDAFRIGAGALLFLSGVSLVQGKKTVSDGLASDGDVAVVPLAIPIIVGPATTGTLLVMGAELEGVKEKILGSLALLSAVVCIAVVLLMASFIQRGVGARGVGILSKLTGLVLAALSAQMVMTGIQGFLCLQP